MSTPPFRVLFVCTANICRSVMAEHLLRREAAARDIDLEVTSCGLLFDGEPASDTVIAVLDERGLDVREHRSRKFEPSMLDGIDLVLTMERRHVREITAAHDEASARVHTFGAFVTWSRTDPPGAAAIDPRERVARFAAARRASDLLGNGDDEVEDPHGRSKRVHRKTAERIEDLCRGLVDGLFAG